VTDPEIEPTAAPTTEPEPEPEPEFVREQTEPCPKCGGESLAILYGEPSYEMYLEAEAGKFVLGGCCISPDIPDRVCAVCGHEWQTPELGGELRAMLDPLGALDPLDPLDPFGPSPG